MNGAPKRSQVVIPIVLAVATAAVALEACGGHPVTPEDVIVSDASGDTGCLPPSMLFDDVCEPPI